ncbi:MAG: translation elongation factor-like protein [Planctomycetes bacterium]|nr:translation elongation factor-like protein [Planctomycetota bacterium]
MEEREIGVVAHYFDRIMVAAIKITKEGLKPGETIRIKGHSTDFSQAVDSIQIDKKPVPEAKVGDDIGIKVTAHCREKDVVYKVIQ